MEKLENEQVLQLVTFRLAKEEYGLPITKVQEINRLSPITKMPQTPPFLEGIINLRDKIIPIIDIRKRLNLAITANNDETRIIMVEVSGRTLGVIVDAVAEVVSLPSENIESSPATFSAELQCVSGIGKAGDRLIILLEAERILTSQEKMTLSKVAS